MNTQPNTPPSPSTPSTPLSPTSLTPPSPPPSPPIPPLPPPPPRIPRRLWLAVFLFVPVADIFLYGADFFGASLPAAGSAAAIAVAALLAVYVSARRGKLVPGAVVLGLSLVALLIEPGFANTMSLFAGLAWLAWVARADDAPWGLLNAAARVVAAPFRAVALVGDTVTALLHRAPAATADALSAAPAASRHRFSLRAAVSISLPAVVVSAGFLWLLALGNPALAHGVSRAFDIAADWLGLIVFPDAARVWFWCLALLAGTLLFVPALRCGKPPRAAAFLATRTTAPANPARLRLQWLLVLAGVNLVFLLTNTLDAVYLWVRQAAPSGVNTTAYLHEGVHGLIFATLLAGAVLAAIFNTAPAVSRHRLLRVLGLVWVAQNLFLVAGVGLRLWLHVGAFCLTPRRLGVAFFLALVVAGFALLVAYIVREKSLRWLAGNCVLAVVALFFVVQFVDINGWCATSAIEKRKTHPIQIGGIFLANIGQPSWRVVKALAEENANANVAANAAADISAKQAHGCWAKAKRLAAKLEANPANAVNPVNSADSANTADADAIGNAANLPNSDWRSWSFRRTTGNRALRAALGAPEGTEAAVAELWQAVLREHFPAH